MILSLLLLIGVLVLLVLTLGDPKRFRFPMVVLTVLLIIQMEWRPFQGEDPASVIEKSRDAALAEVLVATILAELDPSSLIILQHHDDGGFFSSFNQLQLEGINRAVGDRSLKIKIFKPDPSRYPMDMESVLENHFWRKDFIQSLDGEGEPGAILSFIGFPRNLPRRVLDHLGPVYVFDLYGSENWEASPLLRQGKLKALVNFRYDVDPVALVRAGSDARALVEARYSIQRF